MASFVTCWTRRPTSLPRSSMERRQERSLRLTSRIKSSACRSSHHSRRWMSTRNSTLACFNQIVSLKLISRSVNRLVKLWNSSRMTSTRETCSTCAISCSSRSWKTTLRWLPTSLTILSGSIPKPNHGARLSHLSTAPSIITVIQILESWATWSKIWSTASIHRWGVCSRSQLSSSSKDSSLQINAKLAESNKSKKRARERIEARLPKT